MPDEHFNLDELVSEVCGVEPTRFWGAPPSRAAELQAQATPYAEVRRRDTPIPLGLNTGLPFAPDAGITPAEVVREQADVAGVGFWLDLFAAPRVVEVHAPGPGQSPMVLTNATLPSRPASRFRMRLGSGTVWLRADLLAPVAPASAYVGIPVRGGQVTLLEDPLVQGGAVEIAGALAAEVQLDIRPPEPLVAVEEGCTGVGPIVWPAKLRLTFAGGQLAQVALSDEGSAEAYGQSFGFRPAQTVSYVPERGLVVFDAAASPQTFEAAAIAGTLATFAGDARIVRAGWAFPVVRLPPSALGESSGPSWYLECERGVAARWIGARTRDTELGRLALMLAPGRFLLSALAARSRRPVVDQVLRLWALEGGAADRELPARISFPTDFPFLYACDAAAGEWVALLGEGEMPLDRPVDAGGAPVELAPGPALAQFRRRGSATEVSAVLLRSGWRFDRAEPLDLAAPVLLGLRNALLAGTPPLAASLRGTMADESDVEQGTLLLHLGVFSWLPTLPDPYVANVHPVAGLRQVGFASVNRRPSSLIRAAVSWSPTGTTALRFEGDLLASAGVALRQPSPAEPRRPSAGALPPWIGTQTGSGRSSRTNEDEERLERERIVARQGLMAGLEQAAALDREREQGLAALFARVGPDFRGGIALLDVSSNADQIGVQMGAAVGRRIVREGASPYVVDGLDLHTPASNVRAFLLPQVQWEPVRTLDVDQDVARLGHFPTPLASATDGGASLLGVRSQRLVSVVPDLVVTAVREEFRGGMPVGLLTTLPFGLRAAVQLRPGAHGSQQPDMLALTRPRFERSNVRGATQITLTAGRDLAAAPVVSPSFQGATMQSLNGIDLASGAPLAISVLGGTKQPASTVETLFNGEFAPGGANPRVPVTRFDISGYGGSNFSDWANPLAAFATASKVQFSLVVGRTAFEFVKFASILYPWGIRVTRSVTVERRGGGGVVRRDSGWQPASDGLFDFSWTDQAGATHPSPFVFHPGLLRGCFEVTNLRPAEGPVVEFSGQGGRKVKLAPLYIDARVKISGAEAEGERVPALGLLGYLHLEPQGEPLVASELAQLIALQSPIGGPIDCTIDVHGSGFRVRGTRVEVAAAPEPGVAEPRFVGTVRGVPRFMQSGAWSVARLPAATTMPGEATTVQEAQGLPLIRQGQMASTPGIVDAPSGLDVRFADPVDLFRPSTPGFDYGFVQTSPAHALLFRRPFIPAGSHEIRTSLAPCFADPFARLSSKGAFPPLANVIELPSRSLVVNPGSGSFRLSSPVNLPAPRGPLGSSPAGSERVRVFYDEATLQADIQESSWTVDFPGIGIWTDLMGVKKFSGTKWRVVASNTQRPQVRDITTHFHPDFEDVLSFIPNFANRGVHGPVDLGASNEGHETRYALEIRGKPHLAPRVELKLYYTFEAGVTTHEHARHFMIGSKVGAELQAKLPIGGIFFLLLGLEFEAGAKDLISDGKPAEREIELAGYVGVGVGGEIGPFKSEAFIAVGVVVVWENDEFKAGGLVKLEAEINLTVLTLKVEAELKGFLRDSKPPDEEPDKKACDYQGEVAIHVELCFILSISFTVEVEDSVVL